ncbi:MAG TPA: BON domain-containing protein [bacterium]|nr:BON domain-containing protein [bacterium]
MTFNIERMAPEHVRDTIVAMARWPEYTLTEAKASQFQDFLVKCRVYALLAGSLVGRLSLVNVSVQDGLVHLQGTLTSNEALIEDLVEQVRRIDGVKGVQNEIVVGLVYQEWNV